MSYELIAISAALALAITRNHLILLLRAKAIEEIKKRSYKDIENKVPWERNWDFFESLSYFKMLFQLHKWTYKQFYGDM